MLTSNKRYRPRNPVLRVFGKFSELVTAPSWLMMNPAPVAEADASKGEDIIRMGMGVNKLYVLVDIPNHELFTNVCTNDQGDVVGTNYTEKFTNFQIDGITGEVRLGTRLSVDEDTGIARPWYKS